MEEILKLENITKEFYGIKALDDISFSVKKGEILSLCGENGAGKSTLMKIISGVYSYKTYEGKVFFEGKEMKNLNIKDSENLGISIIHQELNLVNELSIMDNIFLGHFINKKGYLNKNLMYKKTKELLKELNLDLNPEIKVKNLGVGEQQLVEIAKALLKKSKLLILDEPTASLTENEALLLQKIIKKLNNKGVTCIYISHKLEEVMAISNEIVVIRDGKFIVKKKIEEITKEEIINFMVGRKLNNLFPREVREEKDEEVLTVKNLNVYSIGNENIKKVDNISFGLKRGEILGIAGLIGAGRTELVSAIYGIYPGKYSGEFYIENKKFIPKTSVETIKLGIALVPEDRKNNGAILDMSIRENITLPILNNIKKTFFSIDVLKEKQIINNYIKELKIKTVSQELKVKYLSGGNQQKVVIAKNLAIKPKVLILDEPTRGIDVGAKYEIYKLMNRLVQNGISIIMVSSELPEIIGICDRVLVMHEGKLKGILKNRNLTQEKIMSVAIGGAK
ncbi:MAG: D-xylose transport system ATP-binding protein [Fusobacteriaceae bacterium]|jgi:D-xylose transport system ATP-binding protein|nr:transporter related [Fusobacteriales bacterium]MDN5304838.1 D-xylose transport system ATP-binding protein [Fusobacteriaceae bacterium]